MGKLALDQGYWSVCLCVCGHQTELQTAPPYASYVHRTAPGPGWPAEL